MHRWLLALQLATADTTAFESPAARALYERARQARQADDSALTSYAASAITRFSMYMGIGRSGPRRLFARQESASRIQWERGAGASVHVTGARGAVPAMSPVVGEGLDPVQVIAASPMMSPVPYFPGNEPLFVGRREMRDTIRRGEVIHPLANGALEFYRYAIGDSVRMRLQDGTVLALHELVVRPRTPWWKLGTGSMWLDVNTGRVVRSAFRMATPAPLTFDFERHDEDPIVGEPVDTLPTRRTLDPAMRAMQAFLNAFASGDARVTSLVVEYGLHEGRWWLPRFQAAEVVLEARAGRIVIEQHAAWTYASVNSPIGLTPIEVDTSFHERPMRPEMPRGLDEDARRRWSDSVDAAHARAWALRDDSLDAGLRVGSMRQCDTSSVRVITQYRGNRTLPVALHIPCDDRALVESAELPSSIFDEGEDAFPLGGLEQIVGEALSVTGQGGLLSLARLPRPRVYVGLSTMRYNRVEGFSPGMTIAQELGGGYRLDVATRIGVADRSFNAELGLARTNLMRTLRLNAYRRLVSAGDWGTPLDFGSSLTAVLFGDDEGMYHRARGVELTWSVDGTDRTEWRLFAERQWEAPQCATASLWGDFRPNITADRGDFVGAAVRSALTQGHDPLGWRAFFDVRAEAATGASDYARAAVDLTLSRAFGPRVEAALHGGIGGSAGTLPLQRHWFPGGALTVRGQRADTAYHGTAFWLGRFELARRLPGLRVSIFGDLGWAGDRDAFTHVGRPWSGAGVGLSLFEGMARLDVARGLYPERRVRPHLYLNASF